MRSKLWLLILLSTSCAYLSADTITIDGLITQSTPDGTGPATFNPSLNNIQDQQAYTLTLEIPAVIGVPGFYNLNGSSLAFEVPDAPAEETAFDAISLSITSSAGVDTFSLSACITGQDCSTGNMVTANFSIPAIGLSESNVAAMGLDQPHPFELLEDDGVTDIQASIVQYAGPKSGIISRSSPITYGRSRSRAATFSRCWSGSA